MTHPGKVLGVVKKVLGGAAGHAFSPSGLVGIAAIVAWAVGGAHFVLSETGKLVGETTSPELAAAWFSSVYWRVAAVAALLTLPFLVAAAMQAVLRGDGALLARAGFGYLPLSFLATGVAAPITMLLLQLTDWMGTAVAQAAGGQGSHVLGVTGVAVGTLGVAVGSPFVTFLIALLTAAGGLVLWLELLIREAAVYVVVLMLPLVFCAMVWPARRVWAVRSVEVLMALVLSKFAIVAVLALAAAALGHAGGGLIVKSLAGLVLVTLGAFAPWVLLRLLPLAEVASAAVGHVREHAQSRLSADSALGRRGAISAGDSVSALMSRMHHFAADATQAANPSATENRPTAPALVALSSGGEAQSTPADPETRRPGGTSGAPPATGATRSPAQDQVAQSPPVAADQSAAHEPPKPETAPPPEAPAAPGVVEEENVEAAEHESDPPMLPPPDLDQRLHDD